MHVGTQQFNTSDKDLEYLARHGVFNKNENFITFHRAYGWDVKELKEKKENVLNSVLTWRWSQFLSLT